ncbi:hypothetical protein ACETU7_23195 [Rhodococcus sp. 3Y1]
MVVRDRTAALDRLESRSCRADPAQPLRTQRQRNEGRRGLHRRPRVLDVDLDDAVEGDDTALGADTFDSDGPDGSARRRLREFAAIAKSLKGVKGDAKLKRLIVLLTELLVEGYHPIVFCRYIPTAEYLAEHLGAALTKNTAPCESNRSPATCLRKSGKRGSPSSPLTTDPGC